MTYAADDPATPESWKPDGWDEWPQKRRTLWRREVQADRMERLEVDSEEAQVKRDRLVAHLRSEAAELRRELANDHDSHA